MKKTFLYPLLFAISLSMSSCARSFQDDQHICTKVRRIKSKSFLKHKEITYYERQLLNEFGDYCSNQFRKSRNDYKRVQQLDSELEAIDRDVDILLDRGNRLLIK